MNQRFVIIVTLAFSLAFFACTSTVDVNPKLASRGGEIYAQQCQACHGDAATGDEALPGVPVHSVDGHTWHHADGQLSQIILGELNYPGRTMPSFGEVLTEEDIEAILAFFKSNWRPTQRASQEEASRNWDFIN